MNAKPDPPRRAKPSRNPRRLAVEIISAALSGRAFAQDEIDAALRSGALSEPDQRLLARMTYGVIRRRLTLDTVIAALSSRPLDKMDPAIRHILRLGAYQILFMDRVPPHAAVNESARLARATGHARATGFVNAALRRLLRVARRTDEPEGPVGRRIPAEGGGWIEFSVPALPNPADRPAFLAVAYSFPQWLVERWIGRYGENRCVELMAQANRPAVTFVRPNPTKNTAEELVALLAEEGVEAWPSESGRTLRLAARVNVARLKAFHAGRFQPQDDSSAAAALLLDARPGETVLDLCASPGGKTTQIAEQMNGRGELVAVDVSEEKLRRVRENLRRLGLAGVACVASDGIRFAEQNPERFDAALVDAPCSNSGALGRRPEARWRMDEKALTELARLQAALLRGGIQAVRPGGRLVYSACSIEPEENGEIVRSVFPDTGVLLEKEVEVLPSDQGDGAYAALLRKPLGQDGAPAP